MRITDKASHDAVTPNHIFILRITLYEKTNKLFKEKAAIVKEFSTGKEAFAEFKSPLLPKEFSSYVNSLKNSKRINKRVYLKKESVLYLPHGHKETTSYTYKPSCNILFK